jgi:hypothetical protein
MFSAKCVQHMPKLRTSMLRSRGCIGAARRMKCRQSIEHDGFRFIQFASVTAAGIVFNVASQKQNPTVTIPASVGAVVLSKYIDLRPSDIARAWSLVLYDKMRCPVVTMLGQFPLQKSVQGICVNAELRVKDVFVEDWPNNPTARRFTQHSSTECMKRSFMGSKGTSFADNMREC